MFPPMSQDLRLAYVGLGNIGLPVARNLFTYPSTDKLRVWNRTKAKYDLIPEAHGCESIKDLFTEFEEGVLVVFTSLVDDEVASEVYGDLIKCAKEVQDGCKVISSSKVLFTRILLVSYSIQYRI
jgi:3-hydroxyisobutyrate dehydrogenase-like beta-hydroxyacid dehydrogenase